MDCHSIKLDRVLLSGILLCLQLVSGGPFDPSGGFPERHDIVGGTDATVYDFPFVVLVVDQTLPTR